MDYEKKYKEALEKARQLCAYPTSKPFISDLQDLFPELAESEDERIRKEIIDFATKANNGVTSILANNYNFNKWLAWLEKQGEQKPVQEIEPTPIFKIGDILKRKGKDYTFRVDRIQGGYYHCDRNHGAFFPIEEQDNWELAEQKPAWSYVGISYVFSPTGLLYLPVIFISWSVLTSLRLGAANVT